MFHIHKYNVVKDDGINLVSQCEKCGAVVIKKLEAVDRILNESNLPDGKAVIIKRRPVDIIDELNKI